MKTLCTQWFTERR